MSSPLLPKTETEFESDEYFQHICDLCLEDDQKVEATIFCTVCEQYLCVNCHKSHTRITATKHHKLLSGKDMPEKQTDQKLKPKCKKHPKEILEYFCQEHREAFCSNCQKLNHRNCLKIIKFEELDKNRNFKYECKQKLENMTYLLAEFRRLKSVNEIKVSEVHTEKEDLIKTVKKMRKRIDQHVDKLEAELMLKIRDGVEHGIKDLNKTGDIECIIEELTTQIKEFEDMMKTMSRDQEIVMAVLLESEIKKYSSIINELTTSFFQLKTNITISEGVKAFLNQVSSFGDIDIVKSNVDLLRPFGKRKVIFCQNIDISSPSDKASPEVQTIEVLPTGGLVICDAGNNKIKLFSSDFELLNEVQLIAQPQSMVIFNSTEATVSFPDIKCLQNLELTSFSTLKLGKKFKTRMRVSELTRYNDEMIALANDESFWYLYKIDRVGQIGAYIKKEPVSSELFEVPSTICLSYDKTILYVVDIVNGCFGISLNGNILFHFKDAALQTYIGVCMINDRLSFISMPESDKIVVINNTGEKIKDLVATKGLETLTYSANSNQLFAENSITKVVSVYMLI